MTEQSEPQRLQQMPARELPNGGIALLPEIAPTMQAAPGAQGDYKVSPREGEILIAVMGNTMTGKSHFCRAATRGNGIDVGSGNLSSTRKPTTHQLMLPTGSGETCVTLIDMPGFTDGNFSGSSSGSFIEIAGELVGTYKQNRKLSGVIYFHRITGGLDESRLRMFRELCGEDSGVLKNLVFATSRWDLSISKVGVKRQTELENDFSFRKTFGREGYRIRRFDGTTESALELIRLVIPNAPQPLRIQREMVDENKPLLKTAAGRSVEERIHEARRRWEKSLPSLLEQMQLALEMRDKDMQKSCEMELKWYLDAFERLDNELARLRAAEVEGFEEKIAVGADQEQKRQKPVPEKPQEHTEARRKLLDFLDLIPIIV